MNPIVKLFRLLISVAFITMHFSLHSQNAPITTAGTTSGCPNASVVIPVTVTNFSQITAISLRMDFDPTQMTYVSATNFNAALSGVLINAVSVSANLTKIMFSWSDVNPATLSNGSKLFDLNFTYLSGSASLSFNNTSNGGADCEYADANGDPLNDMPTGTYYVNGSATNNGPGTPGTITGAASVCQGQTSVAYSVPPIANATGYNWTLPANTSIASGSNTNSITVNYSASAASGNITVAGTNTCGTGSSSAPLVVTVNNVPAQTSAIQGATSPCQGSSNIYQITSISGVTYTWSVPSGWVIISGQGTAILTTTAGSTSGSIQVIPSNACGNGTASTLGVTPITAPVLTGTISGAAAPCQNSSQTYSVPAMTGVTFSWTVPTGWTINSGQGTNSITVTTGTTGGNIQASASNSCGTSFYPMLATTIAVMPVQPSVITGSATPCSATSQTYSVTNTSGITYTWSVPSDWLITAGQGTNSMTATIGSAAGNITVVPSNNCGNGPSRLLAVTTMAVPAQPSVITGSSSPCQGSTQQYSVTNTSSVTYTWSVPTGWIITAGQGTNQVTVTIGTLSGNIEVVPSNACGSGLSRTLSVASTNTPAQPSAISGAANPCAGSTQTYTVTNTTGVTYTWALPTGWSILSGQGTNTVSVNAGTSGGTIQVTPSNSCGNGSAQTLTVSITSIPAQPGSISGSASPCQGTSQNYSVPSVSGITYTWAAPAGWNILSGQGTAAITVTTGSAGGTLSVVPSNVCGSGPASTLATTVNYVTADAGTDQTIAYQTSTTLNGNATNGSGNYGWSWTPSALLINPSIQNPQTTDLQSTSMFTLTVTDLTTQCTGTDQVIVAVTGGPLSVSVVADPDVICEGLSSQLTALASNGTGNYTYTWSSNPAGFTSNIQSPVVSPSVTTQYIVEVSDGVEIVTGSATVTVNPLPGMPGKPNGPDTVDIYYYPSTNYSIQPVAGANSYQWQLDPPTIGNLTQNGLQVTVQWLTVGYAHLTAKAINDCGEVISEPLDIKVDNSIGINPAIAEKIKVYPNPVEQHLMISIDKSNVKLQAISLFTVDGSLVVRQSEFSSSTPIVLQVGHLPAGSYLLQIMTQYGTTTRKVQKN